MTSNIIMVHRSIFNKDMSTFEARIKTFENWKSGKQEPSEMAKCGFYSISESDRVYCFYCGIGLHEWLSEDNVWVEHALSSPTCAYLLLNKAKRGNRNYDDLKKRDLFVSIIVLFCKINQQRFVYAYIFFLTKYFLFFLKKTVGELTEDEIDEVPTRFSKGINIKLIC